MTDVLAGKRLLVVDDDPTIRELYSEVFSLEGVRVDLAENGREALERLEACSFDLILVDLYMPEMDGFELVQAVRADERWKDMPIVVLTADSTWDTVKAVTAAGISAYLIKSARPKELVERVRRFLSKEQA